MNIKLIVLGLGAALAFASCNTISGIGKDISAMGGHMDNAAQQTSAAMDR